MRMSKQEKKALEPALRFPEFRNAGAWKKKPLAPYIEEYFERASSNTELEVYSSTREGLKPQSEYYDGRNLSNDGEYGVVPTGYFVYRHMSDDDVFKFNLNQLGKKIAVSKEYPVFKAVNLDGRFLINKLNEGQEFKRFAISQKKGGTRTRLYFNALRTFESYFPDFEEQKKIADCLTSVDDLINAQTKKLEVLKAHKKGLIRQLFPSIGETVPKCRFPEFRDHGAWEEKTLGDICDMQAGKFVRASDIKDEKSGDAYPCYGGNGLRGFTTTFTHNGKYPLIGRQGALCGNVMLANGRFHATEHAVVVTPNEGVRTDWLFFNLIYLNLNKFATGQAQPGLSVENLKRVELQIPFEEDEQQKIADCLTSIDELISNQSKKVATLKIHKKGLMQKLFPAMDEVSA